MELNALKKYSMNGYLPLFEVQNLRHCCPKAQQNEMTSSKGKGNLANTVPGKNKIKKSSSLDENCSTNESTFLLQRSNNKANEEHEQSSPKLSDGDNRFAILAEEDQDAAAEDKQYQQGSLKVEKSSTPHQPQLFQSRMEDRAVNPKTLPIGWINQAAPNLDSPIHTLPMNPAARLEGKRAIGYLSNHTADDFGDAMDSQHTDPESLDSQIPLRQALARVSPNSPNKVNTFPTMTKIILMLLKLVQLAVIPRSKIPQTKA